MAIQKKSTIKEEGEKKRKDQERDGLVKNVKKWNGRYKAYSCGRKRGSIRWRTRDWTWSRETWVQIPDNYNRLNDCRYLQLGDVPRSQTVYPPPAASPPPVTVVWERIFEFEFGVSSIQPTPLLKRRNCRFYALFGTVRCWSSIN